MVSRSPSVAGRVLVVCTGNVCRSPYIERLLRRDLSGTGIAVTSAGTRAMVGASMEPRVVDELQDRSASPEAFTARQLTADMVADAELVLTATREHRSAAVRLHPRALSYSHALLDFSDLARAATPDGETDGSPVARAARSAAAERGEVVPRPVDQVDIVDPYHQSAAVFARMAEQVDHALPPIVRLLRASGLGPLGALPG